MPKPAKPTDEEIANQQEQDARDKQDRGTRMHPEALQLKANEFRTQDGYLISHHVVVYHKPEVDDEPADSKICITTYDENGKAVQGLLLEGDTANQGFDHFNEALAEPEPEPLPA